MEQCILDKDTARSAQVRAMIGLVLAGRQSTSFHVGGLVIDWSVRPTTSQHGLIHRSSLFGHWLSLELLPAMLIAMGAEDLRQRFVACKQAAAVHSVRTI